MVEVNLCQLMAENDSSWSQEDNSWRRRTRHGATGLAPPFLGRDHVGHAVADKFTNRLMGSKEGNCRYLVYLTLNPCFFCQSGPNLRSQ
jgi:hypothetical protein